MFKQSLRMLSTSAKILGKVPTKNISVFQKNYNVAMKSKPMSFTYAPTFNFSSKRILLYLIFC